MKAKKDEKVKIGIFSQMYPKKVERVRDFCMTNANVKVHARG